MDSRAGETFDAADTRTSEIHLETIPPASFQPGSMAFDAPPSGHPHVFMTSPVIERPAGLFGDALLLAPTPLDRLRLELRNVLARKRGTRSHLAQALGLSRQTFANALSGRERFTATVVAALRRWLDGEPLAGNWPPLPSVTEEDDAA